MDARRQELIKKVETALATADTREELLARAVGLIDQWSTDFNWTGVYMLTDNVLEVGPYIGPRTDHTRIELNSGICGAAASQKRSVIVDDVNSDPRFLACSLSTRSEIVVPLMDGHDCLGEIDIDSDKQSCFSDEDRTMLEAIADLMVTRLKQLE